jgi:hypothetical protein
MIVQKSESNAERAIITHTLLVVEMSRNEMQTQATLTHDSSELHCDKEQFNQ